MNRLSELRNCLGRRLFPVLLMGFLSLGAVGGCGNESGDINSGPDFGGPLGIAIEANGSLLVADYGLDVVAVLRVDPVTGDRIILSGSEYR